MSPGRRARRDLAGHLNCAGLKLNVALVVAAGYLHDLAKGQPDHAGVGGRYLEELGYGRVGRVVATHMDLPVQEQSVDESALIYLADKLSDGDQVVSLEERFSRVREKFGDQPEALTAVAKRLQDARIIKSRLEDVLGISLEELLGRYAGSLRQMADAGPRRIYLVRHGAVETSGDDRRYLGHLDVPLSPAGRRQAQALRERLQQVPLAAIYCSDLRRSVETAAIIAAPHGLTPGARREFREIGLGAWEGLTFDEVKERVTRKHTRLAAGILAIFAPQGARVF